MNTLLRRDRRQLQLEPVAGKLSNSGAFSVLITFLRSPIRLFFSIMDRKSVRERVFFNKSDGHFRLIYYFLRNAIGPN
ncbi:hypothetical protein RIR_jg28244.t1 [Rhizophagus irregularis DAOM 181602=DAOM 197198]|uniref:Uncharacterized protein n=1 Tax=Rhizophagus irregularis (strain DAOM 181602 / DAOM 197198 / MUCL 43194) TaxID=747089 RepID=U9V0X7_RHIID|nr:hypothetical protein RIR_jg28244.t1 [Rhizophagus irregularis DAOM 181602=DAOM 197198]